MKNLRICTFLSVFLLASSAVVDSSRAQNNDLAVINTLKKNLIAMGYEPEVDGKHATIQAGDLIINLNISKNNNLIYAYSYYSVPPESVSKAPLREMLEFNDSGDVFFSVHTENQKIKTVSINVAASAKDISPVALRRLIDEIGFVGHDQENLFNPTKWK